MDERGLSNRAAALAAALAAAAALAGCSALFPKSESETAGAWQSFEDAERTLARVVPYKTTEKDLPALGLDPRVNANITILNYSDVLRRFIPSPAISAEELDTGVRECIAARKACIGYEINQRSTKRNRYGNFLSDFLNFRRKVDIVGWRFSAVILIKDGVVVYTLTGGQPLIHEREEDTNPLGPFQGRGGDVLGL